MTLHSPTENSLAVLNHKILEANSQVQNVKLGGHQMCLSINRLWHELCDMLPRLVGTIALDIMIVQFRNEKVSNHGSIPITIDCNVVAFIVFEEFTCRNCGGGDRGRVAIYRPFGEVSLSLNRTVTCMVLKANDRRTSCPCHDEFRGPRSDYVRQVALATTTNI
ncbi:uncharacterized protein TNCV_4776751 [Trichonephila clavipes]|nr:uncharacterized protein TNCV_4776751 [Trichonephila clavipes]